MKIKTKWLELGSPIFKINIGINDHIHKDHKIKNRIDFSPVCLHFTAVYFIIVMPIIMLDVFSFGHETLF